MPLDPHKLAASIGLRVTPLEDVPGLDAWAKAHLLGPAAGSWSGGASRLLPDGSRVVFLNPTHSRQRQAATLMEEICHILLGHTPDRLGVALGRGDSHRGYNSADEEEAYAVGAAVLVPYQVLTLAVSRGWNVDQIAARYGVSRHLVRYRLQVSGLWGRRRGCRDGWPARPE
jgi:Zn-dependent peptidase ImmA (M78 family)